MHFDDLHFWQLIRELINHNFRFYDKNVSHEFAKM